MSALIVAILTYAVILAPKPVRQNPQLKAVLILCLSLHHLAAYYNCNIATLPGADGDAELFYEAASAEIRTYRYNRLFYTQFLTAVFSLVGPSKLLGCELSILAYSLSCVLIIEILKLTNHLEQAPKTLLLYGILPSPITHFSVTLREAYEALALLAIVAGTLHLRRRFSLTWLSAILGGLACLMVIHKSLKLLVLGLALLALFSLTQKLGRNLAFMLALLATAAVMGGPGSFFLDESDVADQIENIHEYRTGVINAGGRAFYGGQVSTDSLVGFIGSAPRIFLLYMTSPMPWQFGSVLDVYTFLENSLRLILIVATVLYWKNARDSEERQQIFFALSAFLLTEAVWSLGTGNWGTALRHHVVALPLIITLGVPAIFNRNRDPEKDEAAPAPTKARRKRQKSSSPRAKIRERRRRQRELDSDH